MGQCAAKPVLDPVVSLVGMEAQGMGLTGVKVNVTLEISNRNPYPLECVKIVHQTKKQSGGSILAKGTLTERTAIPALGTAKNVVIPVTVGYGGLLSATTSLAKRGKTDLVVAGEMYFEGATTGGRQTVVPYSLKGEIWVDNNPHHHHPPQQQPKK